MKKIIYSTAILFAICFSIQSAFSNTLSKKAFTNNEEVVKKNEISLVSDRATGNTQVRFKAVKAGQAAITVLDEAGNIVLQQTNEVTSGVNNLPIINLLKLAEGNYTVRLIINNQTYSSKFLLWK